MIIPLLPMLHRSSHLRRALATITLVVLTVQSVSSQQTFTGCPPCRKNMSVMDGHGAASGSDSRRVINLRIDNSWGSQTPANIWNATCAGSSSPGCSNVTGSSAISMWNAVPTYYNFRLAQDNTQPSAATDIQITRDSSWDRSKNGCSYTSQIGHWTPDPLISGQQLFQVTRRVIHLPPGSENWSQAHLACVLAHEMGHAIGAGDVYAGCPASIMNQYDAGSKDCSVGCTKSQVAEIDVRSVNQQAGNRPGCNQTAQPRSRIVTGGGVRDPEPYRYYPTCYYYYQPVDLYYCRWISVVDGSCHPESPPEYIGTIYVLTDIICY